jgi:hypothetical protein
MPAREFQRRLTDFYEANGKLRLSGIEAFIDRLRANKDYGKIRTCVAHSMFWNQDPQSLMPSHLVLLGLLGLVLDVLFRHNVCVWGKSEAAAKPKASKPGASVSSPPPVRAAPAVVPPSDAAALAAAVAAIDVRGQSAVDTRTLLPYGAQWYEILLKQVTHGVSAAEYDKCGFGVPEKKRTQDQRNAKNAYVIEMQQELRSHPFFAAVLHSASERRVHMGGAEVGSANVLLPVVNRTKVDLIPLPLLMRRVMDMIEEMGKRGHLDHEVVWQYVKGHLVEVYEFLVNGVDDSVLLDLPAFTPEYAPHPVYFPLPVARVVPRLSAGYRRTGRVPYSRRARSRDVLSQFTAPCAGSFLATKTTWAATRMID